MSLGTGAYAFPGWSSRNLGSGWRAGKEHVERCAAAGALIHPRGTSVQLGEPRHQREAHAHARGVRAGGGELAERFEDPLSLRLGNPGARVLDDQERAATP